MPSLQDLLENAIRSGDGVVSPPAADEPALSFPESVARGLSREPKQLHARFLYDEEGSRLFEEITRQPEYYPTPTEAAILRDNARQIRELTGPVTLVELGSGYSVKTEHLLEAYSREGEELHYVPVDVSESALGEARQAITKQYGDVLFTGINGSYASALPMLELFSPQMVVFLGSSIGNLGGDEFDEFWRGVERHLPEGDFFLLGVDLVKPAEPLLAAYDDAAGVSASFTRNYFARMNRELGANVDVEQIEHVARWNAERRRVEIYARFLTDQEIRIEPLDLTIPVRAGEEIETEISRKYDVAELERELARFGLRLVRPFLDEKGWFAVLLLQRTAAATPG